MALNHIQQHRIESSFTIKNHHDQGILSQHYYNHTQKTTTERLIVFFVVATGITTFQIALCAGDFHLKESKNYEKYEEELGVSWIKRKMNNLISPTERIRLV